MVPLVHGSTVGAVNQRQASPLLSPSFGPSEQSIIQRRRGSVSTPSITLLSYGTPSEILNRTRAAVKIGIFRPPCAQKCLSARADGALFGGCCNLAAPPVCPLLGLHSLLSGASLMRPAPLSEGRLPTPRLTKHWRQHENSATPSAASGLLAFTQPRPAGYDPGNAAHLSGWL
ncbi:hypothetical protein AOLI_G00056030 [Acnodon oligacanthus]